MVNRKYLYHLCLMFILAILLKTIVWLGLVEVNTKNLVQLSFCLKLGVRKLLYPGQISEPVFWRRSLSLKAIPRRCTA
jgi:hypothetical protein